MTRLLRYSLTTIVVAGAALAHGEPRVAPIPDAVRKTFNLSPFYQKYVDLHGFPIVGSSNVSDYALLEAAWIVSHMLVERADILHALASNNVRLAVMAVTEFTTDIPEHSDLRDPPYWDRRARGLGATRSRPAVSCGEENLLAYPRDPYSTENILIHEFAHAIHEMALTTGPRAIDAKLRALFRKAKEADRWKGTYAASNVGEYWAEAVQSWFNTNRENDRAHNHVNTRDELRAYDPELAKLCEEVFGDRPWRYSKPATRASADRGHLNGYDASAAPRFQWRQGSSAGQNQEQRTTSDP
jgi:hypothetical protein